NGIEYTYDALGNLIYRQLPNGENQYYQYDLENQLVRAEIKKPAGNTEIWTYAYDPFGRRLSKERQDKLARTSTDPKRTHFVWDGSRLLQEYTYKGSYTYLYADQDSYEPLAQVFRNNQDEAQYLAYFHNDQVGIPKEMTDIHGNLLWYGEYTAWGRLKKDERVYKNAHQPFRLQNQYYDEETGLHYNLMRYYEPEAGRFVNQDPIGLLGGSNLYWFAPNVLGWIDPSGWARTETIDPPCDIKHKFRLLARFRKRKKMPKAGSELDAHTAARLEIGGRVFYGHNGHGIDTTFDKVNAITKTHAEGHVTQRALNAGMKGKAKTADIYVDRELCPSCGRNNGIGSLARELGLESINVHTPSGSKRYFPPK
ncbi:RHS repeat-associated core domain-containing protein, partial [Neisseria lactamica]|uniref:RHS repeat-associated core domain-containing protein n=1 Tax=Neisseria lactamica TaxID=486 RepID=UPI000E569E6C